ncbi:hypothetical protein [Novosphingobium sp. 9U]|uniref:hypothetical protein n=1 Tax=Novosphingobium sp. 9U TaxID=2653158 RepID=UPI0012F3F35C|nr:hypothetical protein [Novosphingobium sp. 9U]VWX52923.1 conserved membrane hypothetical protein [Novosphingobium sp. 9U]
MLGGDMGAFYLTFVAVLLSGIAARDQVTIAALTRAHGQRFGVLATGLTVVAATSAFAAYAAGQVLVTLPLPARPILVAIALALAGLESLILSPRLDPKEPTHSLGALGIVLLAHQVTDAARFTLFGLAIGMGAPIAAGLGGGLAGLLLVGSAWALPRALASPGIRIARRVVGGLLFLIAVTMFLRVRGIL